MKLSRRHLLALLPVVPLLDHLKPKIVPPPRIATLRPFLSGEIFNVPPLRIDPVRLIYAVHEGSVKAISAARDGGNDLKSAGDFEPDEFWDFDLEPGWFATCIAAGELRLGAAPAYLVTADVVADGPKWRGLYACSHPLDSNHMDETDVSLPGASTASEARA